MISSMKHGDVLFSFFVFQILIVNEMGWGGIQAGDPHFSASCSCSLWDVYSVILDKNGQEPLGY